MYFMCSMVIEPCPRPHLMFRIASGLCHLRVDYQTMAISIRICPRWLSLVTTHILEYSTRKLPVIPAIPDPGV